MQRLIEVAPSSLNYVAETVALWSPGWPTPLRAAGAWSRRGCCALIGGGRVRTTGEKVQENWRSVTGQRWRLSPRAGNFGWDVLELMFCVRKGILYDAFSRLGRDRMIKHEWSSSLRMKTRTEQAAAVLWEPVHVRPPVVASYQLIQVV